jgi:hypothetical protein
MLLNKENKIFSLKKVERKPNNWDEFLQFDLDRDCHCDVFFWSTPVDTIKLVLLKTLKSET